MSQGNATRGPRARCPCPHVEKGTFLGAPSSCESSAPEAQEQCKWIMVNRELKPPLCGRRCYNIRLPPN